MFLDTKWSVPNGIVYYPPKRTFLSIPRIIKNKDKLTEEEMDFLLPKLTKSEFMIMARHHTISRNNIINNIKLLRNFLKFAATEDDEENEEIGKFDPETLKQMSFMSRNSELIHAINNIKRTSCEDFS